MTTVERLLETKGHIVWSIAPDASVFEAVQLMADKRDRSERSRLQRYAGERDYDS